MNTTEDLLEFLTVLTSPPSSLSPPMSSPTQSEKSAKRRETIRKSETKRRKRIQASLEELKQIVLPDCSNKITQNELFYETVKRIKTMQALLDKKSSSISISVNWTIMNDITSDEIVATFPSIANMVRKSIGLANDCGTSTAMAEAWDNSVKLNQLASRTKDPWFIVQSLLLLADAHHDMSSNPWEYAAAAVHIMQGISEEQLSQFVLDGKSIAPFVFFTTGSAIRSLGNYEKGDKIWQQGVRLASKDPSQMLLLDILQLRFAFSKKQWTWESIDKVQRLTRFDPYLRPFGECSYGLALIYSDNVVEQLEGVAIVEDFWKQHSSNRYFRDFGTSNIAEAYVHLGLFDRASEIVDTAIESTRCTKFLASTMVPTLLCVKCKILAAQIESGQASEEVLKDIKDCFFEAINITDRAKLLGMKLTVAIAGYKLALKFPSLHEYKDQAKVILNNAYTDVVALNGHYNCSPDVQEALALLTNQELYIKK